MRLDGDVRAAYALRDDDGELEQRRIEYDVKRGAAEGRRWVAGPFGPLAAQREFAGWGQSLVCSPFPDGW